MDEHERDEISRIQEDIAKILKPAKDGDEQDKDAPENTTDNPTDDNGISPFGETAQAVSPSALERADEGTDLAKPGGFYTEVIKKEPSEALKHKQNARRKFLSACALAAIGCLFIGVGTGVGYPLASRVLVPRMLGENAAVSERDPFYFADVPRPEFTEAKRLVKFLDMFLGIPSEHVPPNSILREFVGGSCF